MRQAALLGLLALGAIWGASFPFIKLGLESFPPLTIVALRLGGAALFLFVVLRLQGQVLPTSPRTWFDLVLVGIVGMAMPFWLISWGEQFINSGLAAILIAMTPLFTVLIALVWTREEQLSPVRSLGVVLGFLGVAVAVNIFQLSLFSASAQAQGAVLLAASCYAFSALYSRRAFKGMSPLVPATGTMVGAALVVVPLALLLDGLPTLAPTTSALLGVGGLTLLSTGFAYILYYWVLGQLGSSRAMMVTYLVPIFALLLGWFWLDETIGLHTVLGLFLVLCGIAVANGALSWRRQPATSVS